MSDEVLLYNGTIKLRFDGRKHVYTVSTSTTLPDKWSEPIPVPSITTILKVIGKGDALTQWAANCAADYVRETLKPGAPLDEIGISALADGARFAFRRASKKACDIGTLVHRWVESYLLQQRDKGPCPVVALPLNNEAANAYMGAIKWLRHHAYKPQATETRLYSLKHNYAGTADAQGIAASVNGKLCIVDWKTSKAIYPEYRFQTAAYAQAYSEMTGQKVRDRWIVRIGKDGELEDLYLPPKTFKADLEAFLAAKKIYDRLQSIQPEVTQ
ncbi:MAG: hypothetical protein KGL39_14305 [Patescibacteria group bacterium]|nr:hypothetical protein [Patescibacteria group bacterium]